MDYQDTPTAGFVSYMQTAENEPLKNLWEKDPTHIEGTHTSPEKGTDTAIYGHKLAPGEKFTPKTRPEGEALLQIDLSKHMRSAGKYVDSRYGPGKWNSLTQLQREAITDYEYNVKRDKKGNKGAAAYPKLTDAIITGNQTAMVREFRRHYTDKETGVVHNMDRRDGLWWNKFAKPMTGVKYQQTAQVARALNQLTDEDGVYIEDLVLRGANK